MKMTKKKHWFRVLIFLPFYLFFLNSCSSNVSPQSAGALFDPDFGARAMNTTIKGAEAGSGLSTMFSIVAQRVGEQVFGLSRPLSSPFSGGSTPLNCSDGGTMTVTGFDASVTDFNFQMVFSNCRENGIQIDGLVSATGISSIRDATGGVLDLELRLGNDSNELSIQNFQTVNRRRYGHLKSLFGSKMRVRFQTQSDAIDRFILNLSGEGVFDDFSEKVEVTFVDFKSETVIETTEVIDTTLTPNTSQTTTNTNSVFNGVMRQSNRSNIAGAGLRLSVLSYRNLSARSVIVTSKRGETITGETKTLSYQGGFTLHSSSRDCVIQGDFSIDTLAPLQYIDGASCPSSGQLSLNTVSGLVDLLANADKSLSITAAGGQTTFSDCEDFFALCAFENFQNGFLSKAGLPGTPARGNSQFITLTWVDTPSALQTSDMDLHVGYYLDPVPPSGGSADALVSWHSGGGDDCGAERVPSLFKGVQAILDIDDCSGRGPEHVTIRGLPAGYYVVAVNSFDLKSVGSTTVSVNIEIGKEVFTFPERLFLLSDKDNTNANAWYRVTDLQCFSEGECTFLAPNPALKVHDDPSLF